MKRFLILVVIPFFLACERNPTLAKVGGQKITEAELQELADINPRLKPRLATPSGKQKILENYVEQVLFYREATRRGLHRTKETKQKLDLYKKMIIAQSVLEDELEKKVKEYYNNHRDEFERVKIAHFLVRTKDEKGKPKRGEKEAQKIIQGIQERVKKGEEFSKLVETLSEDSRTQKSQGDLGYVTIRDRRLERSGWLPLAEHAFALEASAVSEPIQTQDGFHLVRVIETKHLQPLEEADPGIRFRIQSQVREELLDGLKKKFSVTYVTPEKKPEAPLPTPPQDQPATESPPQEAPHDHPH